ncbi:MAG: hypothetical protein JW830_04320 [Bacteroidales bacterium]|nr:hypothetical protein [Bacteroidales bacterium]
MKAFSLHMFLIFLVFSIPVGMQAQPSGEFDTWWERSGFTETPRYDETVAYCLKLDEASSVISFQHFGTSLQGRDLPLLILDKDGFFTPEAVDKSGKIKLLVQGCVHAGETEGKDAGLALFRDIAMKNKNLNLDSITILFIPIFNADGHERFTPYTRINQNGPKEAGWRTTANNLNLNRDYLKADAPEMQAWLELFNRWDPDFFIDCHTTDGADYQYPVTMEYDGFNDEGLSQWLSETFVPEITQMMEKSGSPVFKYVSFRKWHDPRSGLVGYVPGPRFSTGYVTARNRFALLVETHMLKDYKTRVTGTYHVLENTLAIMAREKSRMKAILCTADSYTASGKFRKEPCLIGCEPSMTDSIMVKFRGIDYTLEKSDLTGGKWYQYNSTPVEFTLPLFDSQLPTLLVQLPRAYIVPAEWKEIISRLQWHGIRYDLLAESATIPVENYKFSNPRWNKEPFEGRQIISSVETDTVITARTFARGSAVVWTDQPAARLIAFMFEPATEESFLKWGFFNAIFEEKEYVETYVMEKMAREMIRKDPTLKTKFDRLKAENPEFASNPYQQLLWFYRLTPYYDQSVGLYPVGKIDEGKTLDSLKFIQ